MNRNQIEALADAEAHSRIKPTGLIKLGCGKWCAENSSINFSHHNNTIRWLVDRGYMQLYVHGTVAHITDSGLRALAEFREFHLVGKSV